MTQLILSVEILILKGNIQFSSGVLFHFPVITHSVPILHEYAVVRADFKVFLCFQKFHTSKLFTKGVLILLRIIGKRFIFSNVLHFPT